VTKFWRRLSTFKKTLRNLKVARCRKKHYILQIKIPHSQTILSCTKQWGTFFSWVAVRKIPYRKFMSSTPSFGVLGRPWFFPRSLPLFLPRFRVEGWCRVFPRSRLLRFCLPSRFQKIPKNIPSLPPPKKRPFWGGTQRFAEFRSADVQGGSY
jgi:hypothetical protein